MKIKIINNNSFEELEKEVNEFSKNVQVIDIQIIGENSTSTAVIKYVNDMHLDYWKKRRPIKAFQEFDILRYMKTEENKLMNVTPIERRELIEHYIDQL